MSGIIVLPLILAATAVGSALFFLLLCWIVGDPR
jgi:hypothetical protein